MKILLLTLLSIISLMSCTSDDSPSATDIDIGIILTIKNNDGADLLDPSTANAAIYDSISLMELHNDGTTQIVNNPNADNPKGFVIITPQDSEEAYYAFGFGPNGEPDNNNQSITYIKWNYLDTDTIKVQFEFLPNYTRVTKVWFNDVLKWEGNGLTSARKFEIVKDW